MERIPEVIGEYDKYQIIISILMSITEPFFTIYSLVCPFFTKVPDFKCISKSNIPNNEYFDCEYSKDLCLQSNYTFIKNQQTSLDNWANTFDLYCDKEKYSPMISTSYFLGALIGFLILGYLPDKYGRKIIFMYLLYITCFCYFCILFPIGPIEIIFIFFIGGLASFGGNINSLVIIELLPREKSGKILGIINAMYPFFGLLLSIYYIFINNYKILCSLFFITISLSSFFCHKYLLETPRWLLSQKRYDELIKVFESISRINNRQKEFDNFLKNNKHIFKDQEEINQKKFNENKKSYTFFEILKFKSQRKNALLLLFIYFSISFCFYGIILNVGNLKGNFHANTFMIFLGESISAFYAGNLIDIYGRLKVLKYSLFIGSFFLLIFGFMSSNIARCFFLFLSMIGYTSHYSMIGVFISETFPTCIRSMMYSYLKFFSRFGPLIVPYLSQILGDKINYSFIISGFIGYLLCFFLEETKGKELQDCIPEEINKNNFLLKDDL